MASSMRVFGINCLPQAVGVPRWGFSNRSPTGDVARLLNMSMYCRPAPSMLRGMPR